MSIIIKAVSLSANWVHRFPPDFRVIRLKFASDLVMDRKSFNKPQPKRGPKQSFAPVPKPVPTNSMIVRSAWTEAGLLSSSGGVISATIGASISSTSEYSVLSSLYREVRLLSQTVEFWMLNPYGTTTQSGLIVSGTDLKENSTTYTLPTAYLDVYNTPDAQTFSKAIARKVVIRRYVPRNLDFANIDADAPTLPVPYAGSPGVLKFIATGATASTTFTTAILIRCTYEVKGRI